MNKPKVKEISETLFEVLNHSVKIQTKKGRRILLCTCTNHTRFSTENPFCYHKELILNHLSLKHFKNKINELITFYEAQREIKSKFDADVFLDDLNTLKHL